MYKVSVLIPVYNVEKYIERCLVSVLENTIISDCQIVLINDCSTDNSMMEVNKVLQRYPDLINNVIIDNHDKNQGIACTRNDLLQKAFGEYLIFVDSDDYIEKGYLEKLYTTAKQNDSDIVECDFFIHDFNAAFLPAP